MRRCPATGSSDPPAQRAAERGANGPFRVRITWATIRNAPGAPSPGPEPLAPGALDRVRRHHHQQLAPIIACHVPAPEPHHQVRRPHIILSPAPSRVIVEVVVPATVRLPV